MIKVVIVEDEAITRKGIVETIDWSLMNCIIIGEASNGKEGINLINELKPDLVIADVRMPYMDGLTMISKLKSKGCKSKFILLTAYNDFRYAQEAIRANASDYILKPLKEDELKAAIKRIFFDYSAKQDDITNKDIKMYKLDFKPNKNINNKHVSRAIQYIKLNYKEDINISTVSNYLEISEGYLSRIFKKETGYTFTSYLSYYRIKLSCALLKNCRMKIYQVADEVGYEDTTYFSTLFKKLVGIPPSEYQDRILSNLDK